MGSLENVIRGYLRTAEEKTESAREHSHQAVIDIDDLDNLATPESILLRYFHISALRFRNKILFYHMLFP